MSLQQTLVSVWQQVLVEGKRTVNLGGETYLVTEFKRKKLRAAEFDYGTNHLLGIEQNPTTDSRWAALARQGKRIMQFRCQGRYVANVCEGEVLKYPAWKALGLPE